MKQNKFTTFLSSVFLAAQDNNQGLINNNFNRIGELFGSNTDSPAGAQTFGDLAFSVISVALLVAGSVAVFFIIYGGFRYVVSRGNEEEIENAKKMVQFAILGLVIITVSFVMVRIIIQVLLGGVDATGILN